MRMASSIVVRPLITSRTASRRKVLPAICSRPAEVECHELLDPAGVLRVYRLIVTRERGKARLSFVGYPRVESSHVGRFSRSQMYYKEGDESYTEKYWD